MTENNSKPRLDLILSLALEKESPDQSPTNTNIYYQGKLTQIFYGKVFSWNWAAGIFGFVWLLYRRLYLLALIIPMVVIPLLFFIFAALTPLGSGLIFPLVWLMPTIFFGTLGNWLYFQSLSHRVEKGYPLISPPPTDIWCAFLGTFFYPMALLMGFFKTIWARRQIATVQDRLPPLKNWG